jgi:hypothetical protein
MRGQFLTSAERERLERFPSEVSPIDLIAFFTLSESDLAQVPVKAAPYNQLGFAVDRTNRITRPLDDHYFDFFAVHDFSK